jgi:anti-anti-sigma factor
MDDSQDLAYLVTRNAQGPVVLLKGDLDVATAPLLRALFRDVARERVLVDLSGVTFMDSTAMYLLIRATEHACQQEVRSRCTALTRVTCSCSS